MLVLLPLSTSVGNCPGNTASLHEELVEFCSRMPPKRVCFQIVFPDPIIPGYAPCKGMGLDVKRQL